MVIVGAVTSGTRDIVVDALLVGSATLVAIAVTVCALATKAGAVYKPADEITPIAALRDQVTAVFAVFMTVALNCTV
jgi:hypothetical protein